MVSSLDTRVHNYWGVCFRLCGSDRLRVVQIEDGTVASCVASLGQYLGQGALSSERRQNTHVSATAVQTAYV